MTDPETFYQQIYHRLLILKKREARYRGHTGVPPELLDQIEAHEKAIFLTRQRLDSLINEDAWRDALKLLALGDVSVESVEQEAPGHVPVDQGTGQNPPLAPTDYNLNNIRQLLTKGFSDTELRDFCFDRPEFREVYDQLAETSGKTQIVARLIEHADQHLLFDTLLAWAKERNPTRYQRHRPYTIAG
jgi:hypothetical protein